jgi:hypothetical protein
MAPPLRGGGLPEKLKTINVDMPQTYQYSKMLTRSQTTNNNNNNNVRRSPRFSSNVRSNITFEVEEHDETVRPSNERSKRSSSNLDENEVVIRRSTRLASKASNASSNNIIENEEPEFVIRRSTRLASNASNASKASQQSNGSQRSNERSNNIIEDEEPEVVIRRSTRLASNASNASQRSSNIIEDEEPEVLRRSQRLSSKPMPSFYKDIDQFFDLDNDDDDEDYTPKAELDVDIDFDEASRAWRQNKRPLGNGMFSYNTRSKTKV